MFQLRDSIDGRNGNSLFANQLFTILRPVMGLNNPAATRDAVVEKAYRLRGFFFHA